MNAHLYIEGGDSKEDQIRCREGFRKLIENAGFSRSKRMPRLTACGGRNAAFDDFKTAHALNREGNFIAMLVDSEDPIADAEKPWDHLKSRDNWDRPESAADAQVLLMTTCMETWIVADPQTLQKHYGHKLQKNALPSLNNLETRNRHTVHAELVHATRDCSNAYSKGKRSFELIGALNPEALKFLPSFARTIRILNDRL